MSESWECCVLSGRSLCVGLINRPEESYRLWCVVVCVLETLWKRRPWHTGGCRAKNKQTNTFHCQSQWPRGLRRRSAAARLVRTWVWISPGAWMSVCCKCCVLSGRGHCGEVMNRPEVSYRLWYVVVCDLETSSRMSRPWPTRELLRQKKYIPVRITNCSKLVFCSNNTKHYNCII
jgi:hypothetical protein